MVDFANKRAHIFEHVGLAPIHLIECERCHPRCRRWC